MQTKVITFRKNTFHFLLFNFALLSEIVRTFKRNFKLLLFYQRNKVIQALSKPQQTQGNRTKVLAVIPHITSVDEAKNKELAAAKIEKLEKVIEGLLTSFAHCQLTIIITTMANRNIVDYLPEYQKKVIKIQEESNCDPMFIGFRVQDILVNHVDNFDWFIFLEDDIVIQDSSFFKKLTKFNQNCGYSNALLLPNRYEFFEGTKNYIDLSIFNDISWNNLTSIEIEDLRFAECTNPHAGIYCLSQKQLEYWIKSGRLWKDKNLSGGARESAATFCLLESFYIYRPHPSNLHFLEVKHYDIKYSQLNSKPSIYKLKAY